MNNNLLSITSIKIKKVAKPVNNILAYVSVIIEDCIAIHDIRLIEIKDKKTGKPRKLLAFPSKKLNTSVENAEVKYTDIVHPITSEFREYIEDLIIGLYERG